MSWYGDVHFKHALLLNFLVAEKKSVTNMYEQLKSARGVDAVDKSTLGFWAILIASSEKGQVILSNMCRPVQPATVVTQGLLKQTDDLI